MKAATTLAIFVTAIPLAAHAGQVHPVTVTAPHVNVSQGAHIGSQPSGTGSGKVTIQPLSIKRTTDRASPTFYKNTTSGAPYQ